MQQKLSLWLLLHIMGKRSSSPCASASANVSRPFWRLMTTQAIPSLAWMAAAAKCRLMKNEYDPRSYRHQKRLHLPRRQTLHCSFQGKDEALNLLEPRHVYGSSRSSAASIQSVNSWLKGDCLDFLLRLYCRRLSAYFSSRHHDAKELKPDDSFSVPPAKKCAAYWNCWKDALKDCAELSCAAALRLCCAASE